jgi:hypothetical protein
MTKPYKPYMCLLSWLMMLLLITPLEVMPQDAGQTATSAKFTKEELAQMVAPIALYPDSLVAQILMASTYPLEIVEADRWVKQNPSLKGDALDQALKDKNWDVSVKSLCHFPDVLSAMSQNLDQTSKLGDAVLSQQKDVMDTIQELRAKAQAQGNLKTTEQQKVIVEQQVIKIEPADPQIIYVPTYNPTVVYGPWWYPSYPPYVWYPGAAVVGGLIGFGIGYAVGASVNSWSHCNWGHGNINVNYNLTRNFNNVNINNKLVNQNWGHNVEHRRGVAYRDNATSQRFGQSPSRSMESRREARGYSQSGLGGQGLQKRRTETGGISQQTRQQGNLGQVGGDRKSSSSGIGGGGREGAFGGIGNGKTTRMASDRGRSSRSGSFSGGGRGGGRGGSRGGGGRR